MKWLSLPLFLCSFVLASSARAQSASLDHIAVYVTDLQRSAAFYGSILKLDTIPEPFHDGKHAWFTLGGGAQLHLISGATTLPARPKNHHLCFRFTTLTPFIDRLKTAGIPYEDWAGKPSAITLRPDGVHQIYLKDPDGYWIEVNDAAGK